jgi:hypothetical protein
MLLAFGPLCNNTLRIHFAILQDPFVPAFYDNPDLIMFFRYIEAYALSVNFPSLEEFQS